MPDSNKIPFTSQLIVGVVCRHFVAVDVFTASLHLQAWNRSIKSASLNPPPFPPWPCPLPKCRKKWSRKGQAPPSRTMRQVSEVCWLVVTLLLRGFVIVATRTLRLAAAPFAEWRKICLLQFCSFFIHLSDCRRRLTQTEPNSWWSHGFKSWQIARSETSTFEVKTLTTCHSVGHCAFSPSLARCYASLGLPRWCLLRSRETFGRFQSRGGDLRPAWTFDMARIRIFVTQVRAQHRAKTKLHYKQVLR